MNDRVNMKMRSNMKVKMKFLKGKGLKWKQF